VINHEKRIEVVEQTVTLKNRLGLHVRPAALLAQKASAFKAEIRLVKDSLEVNAKSIMGVMGLAAEYGSSLVIKAWGEDEAQAVEGLVQLFESKFGEE
jgi:phosphotransferase system HPr (HPr) family protein